MCLAGGLRAGRKARPRPSGVLIKIFFVSVGKGVVVKTDAGPVVPRLFYGQSYLFRFVGGLALSAAGAEKPLARSRSRPEI